MDTCFRLVYGMAVQLLGGNGIHCRCAVPYHNQPGGFVPARVPAGSAYYGSLVMAASRVFDDCYSAYRLEPRADIQLRHLYPQLLDDPAFALVVPVQIQQLGLSGLLLRAFDQCAHTLYMGLAVQHNKSAGSLQTQIWCYQRLCLISLPAVFKETDSYINKTYPFSGAY